jgi:heme-degrading monooxygenase HmoA
MFAVVFEVQPKPERWDDYLGLAGSLRPALEQIDGFIANERFASRRDKGRVLSLSIWRDEKAVIRWRTLARHHAAQARGRSEIFADYHLRVGEIVADSDLPAGHAPAQHRFDETEIGAARAVSISECALPGAATEDLAASLGLPTIGSVGVVDYETFAGINDPKNMLLLVSWTDTSAANVWRPGDGRPDLRHRVVRIIRDYGMYDRREAPQYHPPVGTQSAPR